MTFVVLYFVGFIAFSTIEYNTNTNIIIVALTRRVSRRNFLLVALVRKNVNKIVQRLKKTWISQILFQLFLN